MIHAGRQWLLRATPSPVTTVLARAQSR
jgi:hypothetical protein